MSPTRFIAAAAALVAAMLMAQPAAAQKDRRAEAERFFRAGESAYQAGQYDVAAQAFEKAYELLPLPAIAFSTAQAHRLQYFADKDPRHLKRAIELYRAYVDEVPQGGRRDDSITSLAELEPILSRLEADRGGIDTSAMGAQRSTQLMVTTQVAGATARIGDATGEAPLIRQVEPGPHRVRVSASGYFPAEQTATAVEGEFIVVELELRPQPARVQVRTEPGATISVDGRAVGTAPLARPLELPAGEHFVTVTRRGRSAWSRDIEVDRGQQLELDARLHTTGQRRASLWVFGASGAAFAAAGVYGLLSYRAGSAAADLDRERRQQGLSAADLDEYLRLRASRDSRRTTSFALLGAGAAIGVTGVLLYVFDSPAAESRAPASDGAAEPAGSVTRSLSWGPLVGPEATGVQLGGRF